MSIRMLVAVIPVCALAVACGGGATPEPAAPEGAAAAEQKPAEGEAAKPADEAKPAEGDAAKPEEEKKTEEAPK